MSKASPLTFAPLSLEFGDAASTSFEAHDLLI